MQIIADLCGILGFMLSLCIALHQWRIKRRSLKIINACVIKSSPHSKPVVVLRFTLCNLSETPISVADIRIRSGRRYIRPLQMQRKIASVLNHSTGKSQQLLSTPFPIYLAALESQCIYAVYPIRYIRSSGFADRLLRKYRPAGKYIAFRLHTARGCVNLHVRAGSASSETIFEVLRANCRA